MLHLTLSYTHANTHSPLSLSLSLSLLTGVQLRLRSGSNTIRSIPEERELSEVGALGTGGGGEGVQEGGEVYPEVGAVLAGLNEFKSELLQLHALVRWCVGGSVCLCGTHECATN